MDVTKTFTLFCSRRIQSAFDNECLQVASVLLTSECSKSTDGRRQGHSNEHHRVKQEKASVYSGSTKNTIITTEQRTCFALNDIRIRQIRKM